MFPNIWTKNNYSEFINYLKSIKEEEKYRLFQMQTCPTKYEVIGIKLPKMRKIASSILKTDIESFFKQVNNQYYEEIMIEGLILASVKDENIFFTYCYDFIKKIDNWGITDSFCNTIKIANDKNFTKFKELALSQSEYISRVGLVTILNHYVDKKYLKQIFKLLNNIKSDKYYINMAEAWLICELYIKYPLETEEYLLNNNLNKFTQNKAISKINDSYRISKEKKEYLKTLKK